MSLINTVLFDWGGVLIVNPSDPMYRVIQKELNVSENAHPLSSTLDAHHEALDAFQCGQIEENEFWVEVGFKDIDLGAYRGSLWRYAFEIVYQEKGVVKQYVKTLQSAGIRTCMLSNTEAPSVEMLRDKGYSEFDDYFFSCEMGLAKPDPKIYTEAVRLLGVAPEQMLFIDDKPENIEAAKAVGMSGHVMTTEKELAIALKELGLPELGMS